MATVITGIFTAQSGALQAVDDLIAHDYPETDISLLMSEATQGRKFAMYESTKAPEGFTLGAIILGFVGAVYCALTCVGTMMDATTGIVMTGRLVFAVFGFGLGALVGGVLGGLIGMTVAEHEVKFFAMAPAKDGILLGVIGGDTARTDEALKLMQASGATHIRTANVPTTKTNTVKAA